MCYRHSCPSLAVYLSIHPHTFPSKSQWMYFMKSSVICLPNDWLLFQNATCYPSTGIKSTAKKLRVTVVLFGHRKKFATTQYRELVTIFSQKSMYWNSSQIVCQHKERKTFSHFLLIMHTVQVVPLSLTEQPQNLKWRLSQLSVWSSKVCYCSTVISSLATVSKWRLRYWQTVGRL